MLTAQTQGPEFYSTFKKKMLGVHSSQGRRKANSAPPNPIPQSQHQLYSRALAAGSFPQGSISSGSHRSSPSDLPPNSLLYLRSPPPQPAGTPGNLQATLTEEASRLRADLHLSLHSCKFNPQVSSPSSVDLLWPLLTVPILRDSS